MNTLKILAVDDDPVTRKLIKIRLGKGNYQVTTASDGVDAVRKISELYFDVVLTDLMMPGGIDGIGVLEAVKKRWNQTEVILMTAFATVETAVKAMQAGAADYLKKPINFDELIVRLNKIVTLKSLAKDAGDLREAMDITEKNAASTIQDLEKSVFQLQDKLALARGILSEKGIDSRRSIRRTLEVLSP